MPLDSAPREADVRHFFCEPPAWPYWGHVAVPSWPVVWVASGLDLPWPVSSFLFGGLGTGVTPEALLGVVPRPHGLALANDQSPPGDEAAGYSPAAFLPPHFSKALYWSVAPGPFLAASPAPGPVPTLPAPLPGSVLTLETCCCPTCCHHGGPVPGQLPPHGPSKWLQPLGMSPWFLGDRPLSSFSPFLPPTPPNIIWAQQVHTSGPLGPWPPQVAHQKLGRGRGPWGWGHSLG